MQVTHVRVEGRVQGVFFRDFTRSQAKQLNLTGWVKNMRDGSVETVLCGNEKNISLLLDRLRGGSPGSRVDKVIVSHQESDDHFTTFEVRY